MAGASDVLYQYGAIGVVLLAAGYAVRVLFQQATKAHDLERQRADRLEAELRQLNQAVQEKVVPVISEATKIISDALRDSQRRKE